MIHAIQVTEPFGLRETAIEALDQLKTQDGYLGGRVLEPSSSDPDWRVQAFFKNEGAANPGNIGATPGEWLPDGCRHVLIPDGIVKALGIES